ncbi:hemolysin A [Thermanaerovibrio velox DSM 12556]|uniref:Hemolysin A n=1 Tax=Thermanaerovibrio velox DSM 12556 TaxID=926567 RepID=H0URU0_9BACT|nr:TlyA family RNA methyltransferase [Thermanaerovibrio velox]EHM10029.1 hemolysin A [Thermanaerovibrio velox DSM 12556]
MKSQRIRLDSLLVRRGVATSREEAKRLIEAGVVRIDGVVASKPSCMAAMTSTVDVVEISKEEKWVSRGAYKLLRGLDMFQVSPFNLVCVDVGASTGGFTQVLLRRGASRVYSVDVGYGQLAWSLRNHPRVVVLERTNARSLSREVIPEPCGLGVCDVSFISLKLILPSLFSVMDPIGHVIALVKPQFEVGRERVGKRGVVRDPLLHKEVLSDMTAFINDNTKWRVAGMTHSPIRGPEGNIEFLFHVVAAHGDDVDYQLIDIDEVVSLAHRDAR